MVQCIPDLRFSPHVLWVAQLAENALESTVRARIEAARLPERIEQRVFRVDTEDEFVLGS